MKCPTCSYEFKTETDRMDAIYWCPECGTMQRSGKVSVPKSAARGSDADAGLVAKLVMACEAAFVLICNESGHPNGAVKNFGTMEGREVWYGKAAEVRATIRAALKLARGA